MCDWGTQADRQARQVDVLLASTGRVRTDAERTDQYLSLVSMWPSPGAHQGLIQESSVESGRRRLPGRLVEPGRRVRAVRWPSGCSGRQVVPTGPVKSYWRRCGRLARRDVSNRQLLCIYRVNGVCSLNNPGGRAPRPPGASAQSQGAGRSPSPTDGSLPSAGPGVTDWPGWSTGSPGRPADGWLGHACNTTTVPILERLTQSLLYPKPVTRSVVESMTTVRTLSGRCPDVGALKQSDPHLKWPET